MQERFGRNFAPTTLSMLARLLKQRQGKLIAVQPPGHTIWDLDYRGLELRLVLHKRTKAIASVLTRNLWNDKWVAVPEYKEPKHMPGRDPATIALHQEGKATLYLYTHRSGSDIVEVLAAALENGRRWWTVPSYLNRIIFTEMTRGHEDDIEGFGLSPEKEGDSKKVIHVWHDQGQIQVCNKGPMFKFRAFVERYYRGATRE